MNNKRGFTIVELVSVIIIIGLLLVITIPVGINTAKRIKINMLDTKIETIEKNAIIWGQNNRDTIVSSANMCTIDGIKYTCITKKIDSVQYSVIMYMGKEFEKE